MLLGDFYVFKPQQHHFPSSLVGHIMHFREMCAEMWHYQGVFLRENWILMVMKENIYLRRIRRREGEWDTSKYPFSIPVIRDFTEFRFEKSVTYIVGGNGSGKSTLLEAIAVLLRINPEGGSRHFNFHTEETHSSLHEALIASQASLSYRDTYFFRAESYYNVISEINRRGLNIYYNYLNFHEFSHGESAVDQRCGQERSPNHHCHPLARHSFLSRRFHP